MQLSPKTTALILIDLQQGVLAMPVAPSPAKELYARSMRFADRCRGHGALVVRVRVSFSASLADALKSAVDQPPNYAALPAGWDEFPEPLPPADLAITKHQWGAFYDTGLDLQLRRRGIRTLVLGGIATNIGVESTARTAYEHGYELVIPEDLCSGASTEMHAFAFTHILPRLARVTTSATIDFG